MFFRSPDSALSSGLDKNTKFTPIGPMLWKGFVYMQDVSKFVTSAYRVTGPVHNLVWNLLFCWAPLSCFVNPSQITNVKNQSVSNIISYCD